MKYILILFSLFIFCDIYAQKRELLADGQLFEVQIKGSQFFVDRDTLEGGIINIRLTPTFTALEDIKSQIDAQTRDLENAINQMQNYQKIVEGYQIAIKENTAILNSLGGAVKLKTKRKN